MRVVEKQKKQKHLFLRLAVVAFAAYVVIALVDQQMQISAKKQQLASLDSQIRIQEIKNEDKRRVVESSDEDNQEYIERVAREDLDYAYAGERVFKIIAGN